MAGDLLEAGLCNLIVAAALAVLAAAVARWGQRPALAHGLWVLVLLKLVTPPVVPLSLPWPPAATAAAVVEAPPQQTAEPVVQRVAEPAPQPPAESTSPVEPTQVAKAEPKPTILPPKEAMPADAKDPFPMDTKPAPPVAPPAAPTAAKGTPPADAPDVVIEVEPVPQTASPQPAMVVESAPPAPAPEPPPAPFPWPAVVLAAWLGGSVLWLALVTWRVRAFNRVLRLSGPPSPLFAAEVADVAGRVGLKRAPRVRLVSGAVAPMVWSFGRPTVFFPAGLVAHLSAEQRATLIAHELAHLKRADHLVRWLEVAALALYWWCPLAWWAKRELHRAEEECCDAYVVEALPAARRSYASALIDTLDFLACAPPAPPLATGVGGARSVKRRLLLILDGSRPTRLPSAAKLALVVVGLVLLPLAPKLARLTAAPTDDAPPQEVVTEPPAPAPASDDAYGEPVRFGGRPTRLYNPMAIWWAVAVSPDGKRLATTHQGEGNAAGEVWVWDRESGKVVRTLSEPSGVRCALFTPDGKTLVTGNFDNAVRFYDTATWEMWGSGYSTTGGHDGGVNGLAITPDGRRLATAGLDKTARVWDLDAIRKARVPGSPIRFGPFAVFEGHTQGVFSVALTADGKTLLTGSGDKTARIWDVPEPTGKRVTVKERAVLKDHRDAVEAVAVAPDGKTFVTGSWDKHVRFWAPDGTLTDTVGGYGNQVLALAFNNDGTKLAVGEGLPGGNKTPGLVGILTGAADWKGQKFSKPLSLKPHLGAVYSLAFFPDGVTVASAGRDKTLKVRKVGDAGDGLTFQSPSDEAVVGQALLAGALSPDGTRLAVGGENKTVVVWDVAEKKVLFTLNGHTDVVAGVAYSPDGKLIATAGHDKTVRLWNADTGTLRWEMKGHTNWVYAVAFSPDGKTLATGGYDRTVRLWDAEAGTNVATWKDHTAGVRSLAFSSDGATLISGSGDRTVKVWDVALGSVKATLKGHKGAVRAVAVSADGALVASAGEDKTVRVWDLAAGKEACPAVETDDIATAVRFSPRGHVLLAGTYAGTITNINPTTGKVRGSFDGVRQVYRGNGVPVPTPQHGSAVSDLLFAPDGRQAYSVSQDTNVYLWKPLDPPPPARMTFRSPGGAFTAVAVSADGKTLATGDKSGAVWLWDPAIGVELRELPKHPGGVSSLAFLTGNRLLSAGADGVVRVSDATAGGPEGSEGTSWKVGGPVVRAAATPDGRRFAVAVADKPDVLLFDGPGGPKKLTGHTGAVKALAFSSDGKTLFSGGLDGQIVRWDAETGQETKRYPASPQLVSVDGLAVAPDGKTAAAVVNHPGTPGGNDVEGTPPVHMVLVFKPDEGPTEQNRTNSYGTPWAITAAVFGPHGKQLVIVDEDGRIAYWAPGNRNPRTVTGHVDAVTAVAVARDGTVYTAGDDLVAKRWDPAPTANYYMQARFFSGTSPTWSAFYAPDGKVATVALDNTLRIRSAAPGEGRTWVQGQYPAAFSVALSPDETLLASAHLEGTVRLTDMKTGKEVRKFAGLPFRAWAVGFSPDGTRLVACGGDWQEGNPGWAKVWNVADGKGLFSFDHPDTTFGIAYSTDGKHFATGCRDGKVRVFDAATFEVVKTLDHGAYVRSVSYSPDGNVLASAGNDGRAVFWSAATGEQLKEHAFGDKARVSRVVWAKDRKTYAITYNERTEDGGQEVGRVQIWQLGADAPKQTIKDFTGMVLDAAFHPDGVTLAAVGGRYNQFPEFRFFDVNSGQKLSASPGHKHWIESVCFNNAGTLMISGGGVSGEPGEIRVRTARGLRPQAVLKVPGKGVQHGAFSPDGSLIATGGADGTVVLLDAAAALATGGAQQDPPVKHKLAGCPTGIRKVLFSKDGARLFAAGEDGTVTCWDTAGGSLVKSVKAHDLPVYAIALSPDGKTLATGAGDWKAKSHGEVKLWDADTLAPKGEFPRADAPVWAVGFSKDGTKLYAAGNGLRVLDVDSKKELRKVGGMPVRSLAVSPDGKLVAVGHQTQGQVKLYDTATWQEVATMGQHQKLIHEVNFAPDGKTLMSASGDNSAIVWRATPPAQQAARAP